MKIDSFRNEHWFLSNMYQIAICIGNIQYGSAEAAFQAQKCANPNERHAFHGLSARKAKTMGRRVALRPDWESVKLDVMRSVLSEKFFEGSRLSALLLATGDAELIEGNTWGDTYWGVCSGVGENWLGRLLMERRAELRGAPCA